MCIKIIDEIIGYNRGLPVQTVAQFILPRLVYLYLIEYLSTGSGTLNLYPISQ